jgi:hypothetical protein
VISAEKRSRMAQGWVQRKRTGHGDQQAKPAADGVATQHEQNAPALAIHNILTSIKAAGSSL